ncbi:DUF3592 domain-containing protein [Roseibium litorale]|uniref:DUF3592 domain-containing protein n=1 Tax=Roseibium litorale TaxID=2803841 RepID=A0ABR9CRJ6_9HYPH|nr:DUF3592 domain-containing protein [Roseibium litorale]MBD8893464.1 DUF3592 domain-containing protein [Roseibium litorale]
MNGLLLYNKLRPWILAVLAILAVYTIGMGGYERYYASKLATEGKIAPGTLTAKRVIKERNSVSYEVSFQFTAPYKDGAARFFNSQLVSIEVYESHEAGERVPVRFLPSDPRWAEAFPGAYWDRSLNRFGIGIFCIAILIVSILVERLRNRRAKS